MQHSLARSERFELPTLGFEVRCSIQLSYERASLFNGLGGKPNFLGTDWALKRPPKTFSVFSIIRLGRRGLGERLRRERIGRLHSQPPGLLQLTLQFSTVRPRHLSAPANWTARTAKMFTDFYRSR